jgi:Lar family restriction alleviation protein
MNKESEPCPFCGYMNDKSFTYAKSNKGVAVFCINCLAFGPVAETEEEAMVAWNKRGEK